MTAFRTIVLGAGRTGLVAALARRRAAPDERLAVIDAMPRPGGTIATQRSNGFACELGPFAFAADELAPVLALLERPPTPIAVREEARTGWLFDGDGAPLRPIPVDPVPQSFRSGAEELVQACRLELGDSLRLGRAAIAIAPAPDGVVVTLAGDPPSTITTQALVLALPVTASARLLARFDPHLANVLQHVVHEPRAFAFFGGIAAEANELRGYGVVPADGVDTPVAEILFCSEAFAGRALPGRCLVRAELVGPMPEDDAAALAIAERELRRWTGTRAEFGFQKLYRFTIEVASGALTEVRVRVGELCARIPGLSVAR